jgi:hypothetical protein
MQKMKVKAAGSNQTLMKVIKNPVTAHLPVGAPIFGTHMKGELVDPIDLVAEMPDKPIVFVFGAMSKGFITGENCEKLYSFSQYPVRSPCTGCAHGIRRTSLLFISRSYLRLSLSAGSCRHLNASGVSCEAPMYCEGTCAAKVTLCPAIISRCRTLQVGLRFTFRHLLVVSALDSPAASSCRV